MSVQIPLGLRLASSNTLENFVSHRNEAAVDLLLRCVHGDEQQLCLWGAPASGKTHLLQAACQQVASQGDNIAYLPLRDLLPAGAGVLAGLECMQFLCIDDIDSVAGDPGWEQGLFRLYNELRQRGGRLLFTASAPPGECGFALADLASRLGWGVVCRLLEPDDEARLLILQQLAEARGFEISDESGHYLLRRLPRDLPTLLAFVERIDRQSLQEQRRVTIPFLRELLQDR